MLIECFIEGGYTYDGRNNIEVKTVTDFYSLVTSLSPSKRKILFANIYTRLSTISMETLDDDLPF